MQIQNQEHYDATLAHARSIGLEPQLQEQFQALENMAANRSAEVLLGWDFAPFSFSFAIVSGDRCFLNGGLIYHGVDGSAPGTMSVTLEPVSGWGIHT